MFGWYWLADACQAAGLSFVLAHALYLHAIHGGKNRRPASIREAHPPPAHHLIPRPTSTPPTTPLRALLRQRLFYVWRRAELLARIQSHQLANIDPRQTHSPHP